jgi:hypothetical protein
MLREEVSLCHAPVTGIFVASAIFTEKAVYFEHNYEYQDPVVFEHSEIRAFQYILTHEESPKITKILLAAGGKANKFKSYVPCYTCLTTWMPYIKKGSHVSLLELPGINKGLHFTVEELAEAYKSLPFSEISGDTLVEIKKEIGGKTELKGTDLDCISVLTKYAKENCIGMYLTGSSSNRGGAGTFLNRKNGDKYRDIDILFITTSNVEELEEYIGETLHTYYGSWTRTLKEILPIHNPQGVVFKKCIYSCGQNAETTIDCAFSTNFEGTLGYHAYETKNWFHKLA